MDQGFTDDPNWDIQNWVPSPGLAILIMYTIPMTIKLGFPTKTPCPQAPNYISFKGARTLEVLLPWAGISLRLGAQRHVWDTEARKLVPRGLRMWGLQVCWGKHRNLGVHEGWHLYENARHFGNWDPRVPIVDGRWRWGIKTG